MGLPPPVGCRRGIRVRVLRGDNQANSLAQNTLHRREEAVRSNDLSGHDLLLLFARGVIEALAIHASTRGALFDRHMHGNDRRAGSRRPLSRCFDGKSIASLISSLRRVFVSRYVKPFQLAVCRLL
jgi:hypothetical protein